MLSDSRSTRPSPELRQRMRAAAARRVSALRRLDLLDTPPEPEFDRLTRLAARVLNAPVALVSLVDRDRQFFKSQCGLPEPWASRRETPLSHSFCQHVVGEAAPLIIEDAREHPLLRDNLAIRDLSVIAYAGFPLVTGTGHAVGSLCVLDHRPRRWATDELETLADLAASVTTEIELRATARTARDANAELRRKDQRLQLALRAGRLGAWELDLASGALSCTAQCKANLGLPADALLTYPDLLDAIHPDDRALVRERVGAAIERGVVYEAEYRVVWPDGSIHWLAAHGVAARSDDGRPLRMAGVTQEITQRVRARQELEELSRAKSEFMAVMSHELRTPLTGIMAYSELLLLGVPKPIPPSAQHQVRRIESGARHLLHLIEEILTFSAMEAGREVVRSSNVFLDELVEEAAGMARPLAEQKGLTVLVQRPEPLPLVTDLGKARQILLNLLTNAIKFSDSGDIRVTSSRADGVVRIHVGDSGPGIASRHLDKIFDPFWQVDQSLARSAGGTGIGLAVSRHLARLLGGELTVDSREGAGSTFTLTLPEGERVNG